MKKTYSFIFASIFTVLTLNLSAVTIPVSIANSAFSPATFTANVGDMVVWTLVNGNHNVVGLSVPAGAASISSGTMAIGGTYSYTITVAGNYGYKCGIHSSMLAGFSASSVGISESATNLITSVYPNPFKDKLTIKYNGIESIQVFNIIGDKIKSVELAPTESKVEIDFENLPSGMYFYRTYRDGNIVETKKIVKVK
jgi:plastocyanin